MHYDGEDDGTRRVLELFRKKHRKDHANKQIRKEMFLIFSILIIIILIWGIFLYLHNNPNFSLSIPMPINNMNQIASLESLLIPNIIHLDADIRIDTDSLLISNNDNFIWSNCILGIGTMNLLNQYIYFVNLVRDKSQYKLNLNLFVNCKQEHLSLKLAHNLMRSFTITCDINNNTKGYWYGEWIRKEKRP